MKQICQLIPLVAVLLILQACHSNTKEKDSAAADRKSFAFIKNSMVNGLCEIRASGLAITNSNNHRVIDLAKMIITEQTAIDSQLVKLKISYHITVKDTIGPYDAHWIDSLSKLDGPQFDKGYVKAMIGIHRADSLLYSIIAREAAPAVNKFAQKSFPSVTKQLDSAIIVSKSLK